MYLSGHILNFDAYQGQVRPYSSSQCREQFKGRTVQYLRDCPVQFVKTTWQIHIVAVHTGMHVFKSHCFPVGADASLSKAAQMVFIGADIILGQDQVALLRLQGFTIRGQRFQVAAISWLYLPLLWTCFHEFVIMPA